MEKSVFTSDYQILLRELRRVRRDAGLTQADLAQRLAQTQSFISKCERGERRIDVVELRHFCNAMGVTFSDFVSGLEDTLSKSPNTSK